MVSNETPDTHLEILAESFQILKSWSLRVNLESYRSANPNTTELTLAKQCPNFWKRSQCLNLGTNTNKINRTTTILNRKHSYKYSNLLDLQSIQYHDYLAANNPPKKALHHILKMTQTIIFSRLETILLHSKFKVSSKVTSGLTIPLSHTRIVHEPQPLQ